MKPRALTAPRVSVTCAHPNCETVFIVKQSQIDGGRGKYCSRRCLSSATAIKNHERYPRLGERNPNFKGWRSRDKSFYKDSFRAKYPEKALAHDVVAWAIRTGRLVRPKNCQRCPQRPTEPLHCHHSDYSRPLVVEFLCRDCHRAADAERREQEQRSA